MLGSRPDRWPGPNLKATGGVMNEIETWMASVRDELEELRRDNRKLQDEVAALRAAPAPVTVSTDRQLDVAEGGGSSEAGPRPVSRRGIMAAAVGVAGGMLLVNAAPAAATQGQPVLAGQLNTATGTTTVSTTGVVGLSGSTNSGSGTGVVGRATAYTGNTFGMYGQSDSTTGVGVFGFAGNTNGTNFGVYGRSTSPNSFALFGEGRLKVTGRSYLAAPASAPNDAHLNNESISFYLDQSANQLKVRVKYSGGGMRTGAINLV